MTIIAIVGLLVLFGLSLFQLLLIVGMPIGEFAWGGQHRVLPRKLRVASVFSVILYVIFALFLASKAGIVDIIASNSTLCTIGMWVFSCYFMLGVFMNAISRSKKEKLLMTPVALLLAVIFLIITLA